MRLKKTEETLHEKLGVHERYVDMIEPLLIMVTIY